MFKAIKAFFAENIPIMETAEQVIEKIHNEFDTAGEKLLAEAKQILAKEEDTSNGERLKKLGFVSSKEATHANEVAKVKSKSREIADAVEYFQQHYPNNKFITEEIVSQICKKYNLVCGEACSYIGVVPPKNISEIESFHLKDTDCIARQCGYWERLMSSNGFSHYMSRLEGGRYGYVVAHRWGETLYAVPENIKVFYEKPELKICAPLKEFNIDKKEVKDGYKLQNIPDPIVLQPVKGGYLIVSKWGLEASDELVVNQKLN